MERAGMLLDICDKAKNWPNLKALHDSAMEELQSISNEIGKEAFQRKQAQTKKELEQSAEVNANIAARVGEANLHAQQTEDERRQALIDNARVQSTVPGTVAGVDPHTGKPLRGPMQGDAVDRPSLVNQVGCETRPLEPLTPNEPLDRRL